MSIDYIGIRELLARCDIVPSTHYEICDLGDGVAVHEVATERTVFVRDERDLEELSATLTDAREVGDAAGHVHAWLQVVSGQVTCRDTAHTMTEEIQCKIGAA